MRATKTQQAEALEQLRDLKPGDTVYTVLRHVSRSGMYRAIDLYTMRDNQPRRISWSAAALCEGYDDRHEAARASGCGMDMGFHLVYNLSWRLFHDGYECIGKRCPANDHFNGSTATHHKDGGYALTHRWM